MDCDTYRSGLARHAWKVMRMETQALMRLGDGFESDSWVELKIGNAISSTLASFPAKLSLIMTYINLHAS